MPDADGQERRSAAASISLTPVPPRRYMAHMSEALFEIGAPGVSVEKIMEEIRATVARKMEEGAYTDAAVARAERANLANIQGDEAFFNLYIECLRDAVFVDINDFEILERRRAAGPLLVLLKRTIWKLLKFYTYRLWSQQNQINGLLLSAAEEIDTRYRERIRDLEARVKRLEEKQPG